MFGTCQKLEGLWEILGGTHYALTSQSFDYRSRRRDFQFDLVSMKCNPSFEKTLVYLNTVANYSIWRHRNDIRYKFVQFDLSRITHKMLKSIGARKRVDPEVTDSYKIPFINELYDCLLSVVNHFPFDNG